MTAIIDYRAGNLASVRRAMEFLGQPCAITDSPSAIKAAERVIFPGVGAAGEAMRNLHELGLAEVIRTVVTDGTPFLGICIGYQLLFEHSDEDDAACLGLLKGNVIRFRDDMVDDSSSIALKVPEMGWNHVEFRRRHALWHGVPEGSEFYFVHSYYPVPEPAIASGYTTYGIEYVSAVTERNLVACQFHPEKSGRPGLQILENFCRWDPTDSI